MHTLKQIGIQRLFTVLFIISFFAPPLIAKSVYAITNHDSSTVKAYRIDDDQIEYQTTAENLPHHVEGAVGLALDPDSETLFVTYENSNIIEMVNAKRMIYQQNPTPVTGATNLAGIAFDQSKQKLYVVQRGSNKLYVYLWHVATKTLTLEGGTYKTLEDAGTMMGIALDETDDYLYVTNGTSTVHYYDANDPNWIHKGSIDIIVDSNAREAIGIAIDSANRYMYTGAFTGTTETHHYLVRTDINDINNPSSTEKDIGTSVIGLTVDEATGLLYVTTHNNHIEVYDTGTWPSDPCDIETEEISHPADIIVAGDVGYKPPDLVVTKEADPNTCIAPGDYITYTISYDANGHDVNDVVIIDYLPLEVDFNSADSNGVYDSNERTVTWEIGPLEPDSSGFVTVTVKVLDSEESLGVITNFCEMESDSTYDTTEVKSYCWQGDIIFIDADANGFNNGTSWRNAYTDLQNALDMARHTCGSAIWVAEGTYRPTTNPSDVHATFDMVDGVPIYGGFAGSETSLAQRNWITNETILSGDIDDDGDRDVYYVVTANDVNEATIIHGFTITMGMSAGVSCVGGSPVFCHNTVKDNYNCGLECSDSNAKITNCVIEKNWLEGIYYDGASLFTVANSLIRDNLRDGIQGGFYTGPSVVRNNWICDNGVGDVGYGINLQYADSEAVIRNNTIVDNAEYGIYAAGVDPNITNCVIWGNGDGIDDSLDPYGSYGVTYSCIQGGYSGEGNINSNPLFYNSPNDPNNYHLTSASPCIDAGDPNFNDPNERDIDGEKRVVDGDANGTVIVDMGADEYYWSPADFDANEIVNFLDYAMFADNWLKTDEDEDYNDIYDLADNNSIDFNDLDFFCEDWLWEAGWKKSFAAGLGGGFGRGMGGMGLELQEAAAGLYGLEAVIAAETEPPQIEPADLQEIIEWLEELWLTDEDLRELTSEGQWQEFIEAIEESGT